MGNYTRKYPQFSLCGLNCGLCPNYQSTAASRCYGCGSENCFHATCALLKCAEKHGVEYCFLCDEADCKKFQVAGDVDSFITHRNQMRDIEKAKTIGLQAYQVELDEKILHLECLLQNYNDGRRKSFFCLAANLLELKDIQTVMAQIAQETAARELTIKEKAAIAVRAFEAMAAKRNIVLKLRKKS